MQSLSDWMSGLPVDPALMVAAASGLVVVLALVFITRRRRSRGPVVLPSDPAGSPDWESSVAAARHDERRRAIRRGGLPTPIYIVDAKGGRKAKVTEAYVLDRSTGGLR